MNKSLLFGLCRISKWDAVIVSMYEHKCHDRMKHTMLYWCYNRWVLLLTATKIMLMTLEEMVIFFKSVHGESYDPFKVTI